MSESDIAPISTSTAAVVRTDNAGEFPDEKDAVNPLLRVHALLHGRYRYAVVLGLVLGICGAVAAYILTPPKYEIVGYIRIKPYVQKILYQTEQNGALPSFETYVSFQESLIQSQRVVDNASQDPAWLALHRKPAADGTNLVTTDALVVEHEKGTEIITVTASDRDLNVAMAAVKSIIKAYIEISGETEGEGNSSRLRTLEDLVTSSSNEQSNIRQQILDLANVYGTDNLIQLHDLKMEAASRLDSELQDIALAIAQAPADQPNDGNVPTTKPTQLNRDEVAAVDPRMRGWITQEDQDKLKLVHLRAKFGENSDEVRDVVAELNFLENEVDDLLSLYEARGGVLNSSGARDRSRMSRAELLSQQANIRALYEKVHTEALDMGRQDLKIRKLQVDEDRATKTLNDANAQIQALSVEGGPLSSRISVLSDGEKPTTPPKSKRIPMTAAGGLGGMGFGVAIVALWGFADRKVRNVLQVQQLQPTIRILGVLPILPEEISNTEQKLMAAHCVHQIRTLLDTGDHSRGRVLAITSPSAGDGKTSLSLALGLSFANAGYRTLMIDCDIVGGGLTGRLNAVAHRGVGSNLYSQGLLTKVQLKEAHKVCVATQRKLPEVLVELGYATTEDIERASATQDQASVGLLNALEGDPVSTCVTSVLTKGLFILPLGDAGAEHTSQVSPKAFRRIVGDARSLFDVVIVDTGPILGSLEASIVVREVDEVVLAVAQNGSTPLVKRALALLDSLGVGLAGLVFNRASVQDVAYANYGSSSSSHASIRSVRSRDGGPRDPLKVPRLGSLVAAVVHASGPTGANRAANGAENGSANGAVNGAANGPVNGAVNGAVNGTANKAVNGNADGAANGVWKETNGHDTSH